jgi:hypothetical protein
VDISAKTNLKATTPIKLSNADTISINWAATSPLTISGNTISVSDAFLLNTGDTGTGNYNFSGHLKLPTNTALPATCSASEIYIDSDATSGQRLYVCESANTWVVVGDGAGSGTIDISASTNLKATAPIKLSNADTISINWSATAPITISGNTIAVNDAFVLNTGDTLSGTLNVTSDITLGGGIKVHRTTVADAAYTAQHADYIIAYTSLSATRTVSLPAAATAGAGRVYIIKDESGGAATNNIVIDPSGAETIDAASTISITVNYGVLRIYCSGSNWFTF